jgi:hypothetical protein
MAGGDDDDDIGIDFDVRLLLRFGCALGLCHQSLNHSLSSMCRTFKTSWSDTIVWIRQLRRCFGFISTSFDRCETDQNIALLY